jgi:A/G-specific adenine glycosylase
VRPIVRRLLAWYRRHQRALPWRETRDPWRILVSEVMLQQTRVAAVIPYYERFLARFPDAESLAAAPEPELLALWSGLGYYSRARNLHAAAKIVAAEGFPQTHDRIRALPGVGPYTSAAVASIAFGLPHAVLDGNVLRVAARLTAEPGDIASAAAKKRLQEFVDRLLPRRSPGEFNQALMELGATVCLPKGPLCLTCPVAGDCEARKQGRTAELPVKRRRPQSVAAEKTVLVIEQDGCLLLAERPQTSTRLAGFWELPERPDLPRARMKKILGTFRHAIVQHSYRIEVRQAVISRPPRGFCWVPVARLGDMPLSTITRKSLRLWEAKE